VDVTFDHGAPRHFDVVVGADGLHSNVRRLVFGEESRFTHYIGGYLGVFTLPNYLRLDGRMLAYNAVNTLVAVYPDGPGDEARALFLFRRPEELGHDHRDIEQHKRLLREEFASEAWEVPRLLAELQGATDFYFDSISQVRMDSWSRGRVTLVGDAGYSAGSAVGAGTALAAVGAYVLARAQRGSRRSHGGVPQLRARTG
jgi:2-polyprenyl-6-methoxyphenol hydroxylase-like FAD-dependent oxidoreductase